MININGYYISEGTLFDERKSPIKWYHFLAYRFLENGIFIGASKFSRDMNSIKFSISDFKEENSNLYEFTDGQLVFHMNKGKPWEEKIYLNKTEEGEFEREDGSKIKFTDW